MEEINPKTDIKGPLIFLGIVLIILVALFAIPFGFIYFKSKAQCGDGYLVGSMNKGYNCLYISECKACNSHDECQSCEEVCMSKNKKVVNNNLCASDKIEMDLTKFKRLPNGSWEYDFGPIQCRCCCN